MKKFLLFALTLSAALGCDAAVVRSAPDFSFPVAGNKTSSLKKLRGQPVVLLVGDRANRSFKKQLRYLEEIYQQFASKQVVFVAALQDPQADVGSSIPFVRVNNPGAVAAAYGGEQGFQLIVIGKDGNVDYQTDKVRTGERIRDVIQNSFVVQTSGRR